MYRPYVLSSNSTYRICPSLPLPLSSQIPVQTRDRHYSDLCVSSEISDSVPEVHNNGIILIHVCIYVLFYFGGSKITAVVAAAMKLRHLLLERKAMTNLSY